MRKTSGGLAVVVVVATWCWTAPVHGVPVVDGSLLLRLDAGTVTETAGLVSQWDDLSPTGVNDFEQTAAGLRPARTLGVINGQPVVTFTSDRLDAVAAHTLNSATALPFTFFAVGQGATDSLALFDSAPGQPEVFRMFGSNSIELWANSPALGVTPDTSGIVYSVRASLPTNRLLEVREFRSATAATNFAVGNSQQITFSNPDIGTINGGGNGFYAGGIGEILYYDGFLSDAARNITENYLAAKYDRSLLVSNDFYAGRTGANGDYDFDVIGIGQQSNGSVIASPANEGGALLLADANGTLDDGDYVLAGNDGTPHALVPYSTGDRWQRVFYLDQTGSLDATLTFDFTEAGLTLPTLSPDAAVLLLYSSDQSFSFASVAADVVIAGDQVSFTVSSGNLLDGYYTLAIVQVPEPSTLVLAAIGATCLSGGLRRRARKIAFAS